MREENFRCETNRKGGGLQKGPRLTGWGRWGSDNFTRRTMGEPGSRRGKYSSLARKRSWEEMPCLGLREKGFFALRMNI